jgi:hypothetical protein
LRIELNVDPLPVVLLLMLRACGRIKGSRIIIVVGIRLLLLLPIIVLAVCVETVIIGDAFHLGFIRSIITVN